MDQTEAVNSPMVVAYPAAQATAPGALVLYRVGEFYEVLGNDAAIVSRALGIQLTRRRQRNAADIPMCGIPAGTAESAVRRLLAAGYKVALSEQQSGAGGERPLRLMTASTSVDDQLLAASSSNNLTVAMAKGEVVGFAWTDLSTGEAGTCMTSLDACGATLARIAPSELLVARWPDTSEALALAVRGSGTPFSDLRRAELADGDVDTVLSQAYGPGWRDEMRGLSPPELAALAALLDYIQAVLGSLPSRLEPPKRLALGDTMEIDVPTLRGLEVLTSGAGRGGCLLSVLDRTVTAPGARLLVRQLCAASTRPDTIHRRLGMVRYFVDQPQVRASCREHLSSLPDVLRACGRMSLGKAGPRDLGAVRDGLACAASVGAILAGHDLPSGLVSAGRDLATASGAACRELSRTLNKALIPVVPASVKEGGFVAAGFDKRLDAARSQFVAATAAIEELEAAYVRDTGVRSLRIKANTLVGHHVEVPASSGQSLGPSFILRQGLASTTRFTTAELDRLAAGADEAAGRVTAIEQTIHAELCSAVLGARKGLVRIASAAAAVDLVCGLAQAAAEGVWCEPEMTDDISIDIEGGRHPVAERLLEAEGRTFVANDCRMAVAEPLWLLTGPNMAGKSTFLRQVALIVLMAQIGSFVPAARARLGVVDKMFSRIGASDDLAAGRSTFMVEMLEISAILNQATSRSLVILDEVGRGTSTHDGLAIAQACMEYLHDVVGCRILFSTHYHELADAAEAMPHAVCMTMDAAAGPHKELFAYTIGPGRAGQSYGLKVAARAGLPKTVLDRAGTLLAGYEASTPSGLRSRP